MANTGKIDPIPTGISDIATKSIAWMEMEETLALADDLLAGTRAMRKAGVRWLPKFSSEDDGDYQWRLNNAVLRNLLGRSKDLLLGHMLRDGLDKTNLKIDAAIAENFDLMGTSIDQYAANVAGYLLTHGMAHTYSDFPSADGERTLEDERLKNIRPYALLINPRDLKFASAVWSNGIPFLTDIRWWVQEEVASGLGEVSFTEIRRIRVIREPVEQMKVGDTVVSFKFGDVIFEIWRASDKTNFGIVKAGILKGHKEIPLRTAYSEYKGFMRSTPVLESVAQKNREHWQASSDHNSIIQMSRFPMFYATGLSEEELRNLNTLGPHRKLASTNERASFGYVETTGSSIEQSFKDLERIARDAEQQSVEALYKAGSDTATGRRIDLIENLSPAQRAARETERHMNQVLKDFGTWLNKDLGTIKIPLDFGYSENEQVLVSALQAARAGGDIPRTYYLKRLQEIGVIGDDVKPEQLAAEADNEQAERALNSSFGDEGDNKDNGDNGDKGGKNDQPEPDDLEEPAGAGEKKS